MKIAFLLNTVDDMGGTERAIFTQAEYLASEFDVEIVSVFRTATHPFFGLAPQVSVRYLIDAVPPGRRPMRHHRLTDQQCRALAAAPSIVISQKWEPTFNRLVELELERALRDIDADVVVTTLPALAAATATWCPASVATVHQEHRVSQFRGVTGDPLFQFAPRLDGLATLSHSTREWFAESLRDAAPRLVTIPNSLPRGFRPKSGGASKYVTIAGRLEPEKRIDHALRAWAQVAAAHPEWTLRVAGTGSQMGSLRDIAERLDVSESVHFVGSISDMSAEWAKSSIALLTSQHEAFGLVLIEAFAAGVPVVAYDVPTGPGEVVDHGVNGLLVDSGDIDGLAAALRTLIEDDELRRQLGRAAVETSNRYEHSMVMSEWADFYRGVVAEHGEAAYREAKADRIAAWVADTGGFGLAPTAPLPDRPSTWRTTRDIENQIEKARADVVRSNGWLCLTSDQATPQSVAHQNLQIVTEILDSRGIDYWVVRDPGTRTRVGMLEESRDAVLDAMEDALAARPVYAQLLRPNGSVSGTTMACLASAMRGDTDLGGLRVFQPVTTSGKSLRYGPASACDVEFWRRDGDGALRPMVPTVLGSPVPGELLAHRSTVQVQESTLPTLSALTETLVTDVTFPIDAVYTWVDGSDPRWLARRAAVLGDASVQATVAAGGAHRFTSRDELRYSLRSLHMYASWIRKIWIVTDDQVPAWLDTDNERICVVDHREIFSDPTALPTFNSHAIESQLHRIEGLAEHFLYFNDDLFLGREVRPSVFFEANGVAKHFRSITTVPMTPVSENDDLNIAAAKNNRQLIQQSFGRTLTHAFLHVPHALRVSVLRELEAEYRDAVRRTAHNRLRSTTDIAIPSSLAHYYGFFTGRSAPGSIRSVYVDLGNREHHPLLSRVLTARGFDSICLADTHHSDLGEASRARAAELFMSSYYPIPSPFERPFRGPVTIPNADIVRSDNRRHHSGGSL